MVKHTDLRDKGEGTKVLGEYEQTAVQALESMLVNELGFGGFVVDLLPTKVVVETYILGTKDTTIFEGPEEEMELLVRVAAHHFLITNDEESRSVLIEKASDFLERLPEEVGGLPLFIEMATPFLVGGRSASVALLFALGVTDPEVVKTFGPISLKDLVAAAQLSRETGTPLPEIVRDLS